jgi:hypothetical protein
LVKQLKARLWPGRDVRARRITYSRFAYGHNLDGKTTIRHNCGGPELALAHG